MCRPMTKTSASPEPTRADKAARTTEAARQAIDEDRRRRAEKTARLKTLREERDKAAAAPEEPKRQARRGRRTLTSKRVQAAFAAR